MLTFLLTVYFNEVAHPGFSRAVNLLFQPICSKICPGAAPPRVLQCNVLNFIFIMSDRFGSIVTKPRPTPGFDGV